MLMNHALWMMLRYTWSNVVISILSVVCKSVLFVIQWLYIGRIIISILNGKSFSSDLVTMVYIIGLYCVLSGFGEYIKGYCESCIQEKLRVKALEYILQQGPIDLVNKRTGEVTGILCGGISAVVPYYVEYLPNWISVIVTSVGVSVVVWSIHWIPAMVYIVGVVGIMITPMSCYKRLVSIGCKTWSAMAKFRADLLDHVQGMETLKQFRGFEQQSIKIDRLSNNLYHQSMETLSKELLQKLLEYTFEVVASFMPIFCIIVLGIKGELSGEQLIIVFLVVRAGFVPVKALMISWNLGFKGMNIAPVIAKYLKSKSSHHKQQQTLSCSNKDEDKSIIIDNLTFRFSEQKNPLFENLNLIIPEGKITAIVGYSGSGKSTLVKILSGLLPFENGTIRRGEQILNITTQNLWRHMIGVVWQDSRVFSATLRDNIKMGKSSASNKEVEQVVSQAQLRLMVDRLPKGIDTCVGELGFGLSGGEKQRICIARCLLRSAEVIILDEPTSALDESNQSAIIDIINRLVDKKTVVMIAHRLSTVKNANQIVVLNKGKVEGVGTHEELMQTNNHYKTLVRLQLDKKIEEE